MSGIDETVWGAVQSLARHFIDRGDTDEVRTLVNQRALREVHVHLQSPPDLSSAKALLVSYHARDFRTYVDHRSTPLWVEAVVPWEDHDVTVHIVTAHEVGS